MRTYVVKHIEEDLGPLSTKMKEIKPQPYSYTSKLKKAESATMRRCFVYVVEVRRDHGTQHFLGYKYRAREYHRAAGGKKWGGHFDFKLSISYGIPSEGLYFDNPVLISDPGFNDWYQEQAVEMVEMPPEYESVLENMFSDPTHGAKAFKV